MSLSIISLTVLGDLDQINNLTGKLGKIENVANYEFGKTLSNHADIVVVIGKHNAEMIIKGLIDGGMDREDIKFAKSLNKGNAILNEIMCEGDVVLFENDLPDNYN